ncbi:hypothetical protein ACFLQU_03250 [Verrucomicrobiota bacterium]
MSGLLVICADASSLAGVGHVIRSIALGQAWAAAGGRVAFATEPGNPLVSRRLECEGWETVIIPNPQDLEIFVPTLGQLSDNCECDRCWVLCDGYHFDQVYHRAVRDTGCRLVIVDDFCHLPEYEADVLLNQNITASGLEYCCLTAARELLGTHYALDAIVMESCAVNGPTNHALSDGRSTECAAD